MKIKSVLAAVAAAAVLSVTAVCGFAAADGENSVENADELNSSETASAEPAEASGEPHIAPAAEAGETVGTNPETGVESVAAVTGAIVLAGAAVVISRKRA